MKKIVLFLASLMLVLSFSTRAFADTGSMSWGEYGSYDYKVTEANVQDNDTAGCNCTGHIVDTDEYGGYSLRSVSYTSSIGRHTNFTYYLATDGKWRALCKWWQIPDGSWTATSAGQWGSDFLTCYNPVAGGGTGGGGGSW